MVNGMNNVVVGKDLAEKGGKIMAKEAMVRVNGEVVTKNEGGNSMLSENTEVRCHCLYCNKVLTKKNAKYCDRNCYNASRKAKSKSKGVATKASVSSGAVNKVEPPINVKTVEDRVLFEKALVNLNYFKSVLTLHRLKKLASIAGERAIVVRVAGGIAIHWVVADKCYIIYYAPGRFVTHRTCEFEGIENSIQKLMNHKRFKDVMRITEYIALAEKMKGGE